MAWEQPGHLIHRPSGTRLALAFFDSIFLRAFLNQAIQGSISKEGLRLGARGLGQAQGSGLKVRDVAQSMIASNRRRSRAWPPGTRTCMSWSCAFRVWKATRASQTMSGASEDMGSSSAE